MRKKVAIFDVDGTIFRSSLLVELVDTLIRRAVFPPAASSMFAKEHELWLNRTGTYEEYIGAVIKAFDGYLKGVKYSDFMDAIDSVVTRHQFRVYRYTRDLIEKLKDDGYFLLAISQSPKAILDKFCKELGFDKVYGRLYELGPEDRLTGEPIDVHLISNKANIVKRAVEKEKLTLKGSIGVGDTESDISLLEMVENPICFNPNEKLYKYAKLNKWKVVVERKDVIYEI